MCVRPVGLTHPVVFVLLRNHRPRVLCGLDDNPGQTFSERDLLRSGIAVAGSMNDPTYSLNVVLDKQKGQVSTS